MRTIKTMLMTQFLVSGVGCDDAAAPTPELVSDATPVVPGARAWTIADAAVGVAPGRLAVLWHVESDTLLGSIAELDADGRYVLATDAPPDERAYDSLFGRLAEAHGLAEPRVAVGTWVGLAPDDSLVPGGVPGHFIVHVERDLPADSFAGVVLGPLGAGYHALRVVPREVPREHFVGDGGVCVTLDDPACAAPDAPVSGLELSADFSAVPFDQVPAFDARAIPFVL